MKVDRLVIGLGISVAGAVWCGSRGVKIVVDMNNPFYTGGLDWRDVWFVGLGLCLGIAAYFMMKLDDMLKQRELSKLVAEWAERANSGEVMPEGGIMRFANRVAKKKEI